MGHFARLVNSEQFSNDTNAEALENFRHVALEGARDVYPLGWICCFRAEDLADRTLRVKKRSVLHTKSPVASVEDALKNLEESLARFERLTGEAALAREYWQFAVDAIRGLPHRFVTLDVSDFIFLDEKNSDIFTRGFGTRADPMSGSDELFEYHSGTLPVPLATFTGPRSPGGQGKVDRRSTQNGRVLFCPQYDAASDPAAIHAALFEKYLQGAALGRSWEMLEVGVAYLHGRGVEKNRDEGLRWCIQSAEAGWESAMRFLANQYRDGSLGIARDKEKAAYWQGILEGRR